MKNIFYAPLVLFFVACAGNEEGVENENGEETQNSSVIKPPFEGDFQNDTIFKIDPTKKTVVSSPNGSSIEIPANAIVDKDGNLIKKEVELSFTQYHSRADILASGIPMEYDSADASGTFESAGMFSLYGKSNGKEVYLKEGTELSVNLASDSPEPYSFYSLNEQSGDWTYENNPGSPLSNARFDASRFPVKPKEADKNAFVLDLNFDLSDYSELSTFSGIVWEYVGEHDSLDPRKNHVVQSTLWTDFSLEPTYENGFEYYLTMMKGDISFVTKVRAALQGNDFKKAMAKFEERKKEIADEMDYLQKPYIRAVRIQGFGVYNCDRLYNYDTEYVKADFDFGKKHNKHKDKILVFTFFSDINAVMNYPQDRWGYFPVTTELDQKIVAVLPGNLVATCKSDLSKVKGKDEFKFKMKVQDKPLDEKADLEELLANL